MTSTNWNRVLGVTVAGLVVAASIYGWQAFAQTPPGLGRPDQGPPMEAAGIVESVDVNPHGDMDGFVLEDGTVVKFSPHQGVELAKLAIVGAKVTVTGRRHETPDGEVHLHADVVTDEATGQSLRRDEPHGRPGPPPHAGGPQYEEILRELRAIRRLLEERRDG